MGLFLQYDPDGDHRSEISAWFEAHIRVIDNRETLEVLTERRETNRRDAIEAEAVGIAFQSVWLSL